MAGGSPYLSMDSTTEANMLTPNVSDATEDTVLDLTVAAQDHGEPSLNAIGESGHNRGDTVLI